MLLPGEPEALRVITVCTVPIYMSNGEETAC